MYVTKEEYKEFGFGDAPSDFENLVKLAGDMVDYQTRYFYVQNNILLASSIFFQVTSHLKMQNLMQILFSQLLNLFQIKEFKFLLDSIVATSFKKKIHKQSKQLDAKAWLVESMFTFIRMTIYGS